MSDLLLAPLCIKIRHPSSTKGKVAQGRVFMEIILSSYQMTYVLLDNVIGLNLKSNFYMFIAKTIHDKCVILL